VNVNTGDIAWREPLGSFDELDRSACQAGTPEVRGGPIAPRAASSSSGATIRHAFRAWMQYREELCHQLVDSAEKRHPLLTRARNGKQYVAILAGGDGRGAIPAGAIRFTLP